MKLETVKLAAGNVRLAPEAKPWHFKLASAIIPGYVEPGLIYEDWLLECLENSKVWIDAGCGDNSEVLQREFFQGTAVGFDRPFQPVKKYLAADIYHLPLPSGSADLVTSRWVMEHLERPAEALKEMARVLRPGGTLLIRTTNRLHYTSALSRLLPMGWKQRITGKRDLHHTYYRLNDLRQYRRLSELSPGLRLARLAFIENLHYGNPAGFALAALAERALAEMGLEWLKSSVLLKIIKE